MRIRPSIETRRSLARGVTLSETLVVVSAVAVLLTLLSLGMGGIRTELKREQAIALMRTLDSALGAYHEALGEWPADLNPNPSALEYGARPASRKDDDASGQRVIDLMAHTPASRVVLETLPDILREKTDRATPSAGEWNTSVRDPWGNPLRCLTSRSPLIPHRMAVAANRNRPIFISAGPDGRFGFSDVSAASDNIRSDEIEE